MRASLTPSRIVPVSLIGIAVAPLFEPLARRIETAIFCKTGDQSLNSDELSSAPGDDAAQPSR